MELNSKKVKSVNIFLGFFFFLNYCLGAGYLGVPYAFFYCGYVTAIPTLLVIAFISWINANYLLESMSRAQALEYLDGCLNSKNEADNYISQDSEVTDAGSEVTDAGSEVTDSGAETDTSLTNSCVLISPNKSTNHPIYELTFDRKFEVSELCRIFFNKYVSYVYIVALSLYAFLNNWTFSTVAGSAWASNLPFHKLGSASMCSGIAFQHQTLPSGGCLYGYYFSLTVFAVIVISLSLFDLREQAIVQATLGLLRFVTLAAIITYCIISLVQGGDACRDELEMDNMTTSINVEMEFMVLRSDLKGWLVSIPVFINAFILHNGISSLMYPVEHKSYHHWLLMSAFFVSMTFYLCLGIVFTLWFRAATQETATLNWAVFSHPRYPIPLRLVSYFIILFPSLDVIAGYPLINHVISNNLYSLITGQDTSKESKYQFDRLLRLTLRFVVAVVPIVAAFGVANLISIVKYAGFVGFMNFFFPVVLQLRSIHVCKKKFAKLRPEVSTNGNTVCNGVTNCYGGETLKKMKEIEQEDARQTLMDEEKENQQGYKEKPGLYMTPYSFGFLSHPFAACVMGVFGILLFMLALVGLFVQLDRLTCDSLLSYSVYFKK